MTKLEVLQLLKDIINESGWVEIYSEGANVHYAIDQEKLLDVINQRIQDEKQ